MQHEEIVNLVHVEKTHNTVLFSDFFLSCFSRFFQNYSDLYSLCTQSIFSHFYTHIPQVLEESRMIAKRALQFSIQKRAVQSSAVTVYRSAGSNAPAFGAGIEPVTQGYRVQQEATAFKSAPNKVEYMTGRIDDVLNYRQVEMMGIYI